MVKISSTVIVLCCAVFADSVAYAQETPLSESEVRCFIEACRGFRLAKPQTNNSARPVVPKLTPSGRPARSAKLRDTTVQPSLPANGENTLNMRLSFDTGSAVLTEQSVGQVDMFARALSGKDIKTKFLIAGHTDSSGSRSYNLALSRRRANAVVGYLVDHGVNRDLLKAAGYGPDRPLGDSTAEDPKNRRVEIVRQAGG